MSTPNEKDKGSEDDGVKTSTSGTQGNTSGEQVQGNSNLTDEQLVEQRRKKNQEVQQMIDKSIQQAKQGKNEDQDSQESDH